VSFQYDQRGRRISRTLPAGQTESFTYDGNGNVLTHSDFNGKTTTYTYDAANHLLTKVPDPSLNETTVTYTYFAGLRSTMADASGTTNYTYTGGSHLQQKHTPEGTVNFIYDLAGNLTSLNGGTAVTYTYDVLNRLSTVSESGNLRSAILDHGGADCWKY
jgi:YD repeat-containing protein